MSFAAGYKGDECLARSANTFQPRAQHIGQGSRAKWTRRTSIKFGMLLPSAIRRILAACSTSLSCAVRSRLSDLDHRAAAAVLTMLPCVAGQHILERRI